MFFFDYVFYRVSSFYLRTNPKGGAISGLAVVVLLQSVNLFSLYVSLFMPMHTKAPLNKFYAVLLYIILLVLNGIRYNKLDLIFLGEKWKGETARVRARNGLFVVLYIVGTFAIALTLILTSPQTK